ncbi:MAG: amidohydrolase [Nitriliruptoraceae bacterium]
MSILADCIVVNSRIWRGSGGADGATAIAIHDERIVQIGSDADVLTLRGPGTTVIDAGGRRVIPGLIDSHIHMVRAGLTWNQNVDWSGMRSIAEGLDAIRAKVDATPPGTWVCVVGGWGPGQFTERRMPTIEEIRSISDDHPIFVQYLYESAVVNAAGLAAIGITAETPDPARGWFERDDSGAPTGFCRGVGAFMACIGAAGRPDFETQIEWTAAIMARFNRLGITGVVDPGGMGMSPEAYRPLFELWRRGGMTVRTRLYLMPQGAGLEREQIAANIKHLHPGFGDTWLRLTGAGEMVSYGFFDLEGVQPFEVTDEGADLLRELLEDLLRAGWSIHLHAVLRATITRMLDVIEDVLSRISIDPDRVRISLAHIEPITDQDLDRMARLGIGAGIQDRMLFRAKDSAEFWGEDVLRRSPPLRGFLDRGIPVGGGTDATAVSPYNPWQSIWWLVTGRTLDDGPPRDERWNLTREEALSAYTEGSAWLSLDEKERGRLDVGLLGDLVILSEDYFEVDEDAIAGIEADATVVGGRLVHAVSAVTVETPSA